MQLRRFLNVCLPLPCPQVLSANTPWKVQFEAADPAGGAKPVKVIAHLVSLGTVQWSGRHLLPLACSRRT